MVHIQQYTAAEKQWFFRLLRDVFAMRAEYADRILERKFLKRPASNKTVTALAINDSGEVVGQYSNAGLTLTHGRKPIDGYLCLDMCMAAAYRWQGILGKTAKLVYESINRDTVTIWFSNAEGVKIDRKWDNGYTIVGQISKVIMPTFTLTSSPIHLTRIEAITHYPTIGKDVFSILKDEAYVSRRYQNKPYNTYRVYTLSDNKKDIGRCVLVVSGRNCHIYDIQIDEGVSSADAITALKKEGMRLGCLSITRHILENDFWKNFFGNIWKIRRNRGHKHFLTIKIHNQKDFAQTPILSPEHRNIQGGDIM